MYSWYWKGAEYYISTHFSCIPTGFSTTPAIVCIVALPCDGPRSQEKHPHVNEVKKISQIIHMQQYPEYQTLKCCGCSHTGTTYLLYSDNKTTYLTNPYISPWMFFKILNYYYLHVSNTFSSAYRTGQQPKLSENSHCQHSGLF